MSGRLILATLLSVIWLAHVAPVGAQAASDQVNLRLDFWSYGAHAGFAYGIEKGIYADEGINLTLLEGNGSGPVIQAIGSGIDRFAYADATTMAKLASKGLPVKMIANYMQVSPLSILFFQDKISLKTPSDLVGKKVAFTLGDSIEQSFPAFLKAAGVNKDAVREVSLDPQAKMTALIQGVVDAMGGYYITFVPLLEDKTKRKVGYLRYADFGVSLLANGLVMNDEYLSDRSLNCRMIKATNRAFEGAIKDPAGAVDALHKLFPKTSGGNEEVTTQTWLAATSLVHSASTVGRPLGYMAEADWKMVIDIAKNYGGLSPVKDPSFYYTNDFIDCPKL